MPDKPWLFDRFVRSGKKLAQNREGLDTLLGDAKEKARGSGSALRDALEYLLAFIRLVAAWAKGEYRDVSLKTIAILVAAILYFVTPLDLLPDLIPFLGFADDTVFILYVLSQVREEVERFLEWERANKAPPPPQNSGL